MKRRIAFVVSGKDQTHEECCLEKVVDFFGIERQTLTPEHLDAANADEAGAAASEFSVLVSATHLGRILGTSSAVGLPSLLRRAASVFVFGFSASEQSARLLQTLVGSRDARVDIRPRSTQKLSVAGETEDLSGSLSGITVDCDTDDDCRTFHGVSGCDGFRSLMSTPGGEVFFECRYKAVRFFLSASACSLDIDRPEDGTFFDIRRYFTSVVPLAIFLKSAAPGARWSAGEISATLIVDDPALKRRYGFLQFERVLASMDRHDFCTTIAFIPWNWRRTDPRTANIFRNNPDRYSLVVHGCDHTANEFGTASLPVLNNKTKAAQRRSAGHFRRTGIRVSPIMVFPHGAFSAEAAYVLKCNNFIAAVNTEVNPVGEPIPSTRVRELWDVAITRYSSFPIYTRRYMSHGLVNFAFDSFLGKPCLLVAHHEVFKDDGRELTAFVDSLNSLAGGVRWRTLEQAITSSHVAREGGDCGPEVRMFANQTVFENRSSEVVRVLIEKKEADQRAISRIVCDKQNADWTWENGTVRFVADVPPNQTSVIRVEFADPLGEHVSPERAKDRIRVGARRYLSEFRDDFVSRSPILSSCADKAMRFLK
jgi:hypothetical protein